MRILLFFYLCIFGSAGTRWIGDLLSHGKASLVSATIINANFGFLEIHSE